MNLLLRHPVKLDGLEEKQRRIRSKGAWGLLPLNPPTGVKTGEMNAGNSLCLVGFSSSWGYLI